MSETLDPRAAILAAGGFDPRADLPEDGRGVLVQLAALAWADRRLLRGLVLILDTARDAEQADLRRKVFAAFGDNP